MSTLAQTAGQHLGTRFSVEQTGGGCEALVSLPLEGGIVVVITDGNASVPAWDSREIVVGIYTVAGWNDSGDDNLGCAALDATCTPADPDSTDDDTYLITPAALTDTISRALAGATATLSR